MRYLLSIAAFCALLLIPAGTHAAVKCEYEVSTGGATVTHASGCFKDLQACETVACGCNPALGSCPTCNACACAPDASCETPAAGGGTAAGTDQGTSPRTKLENPLGLGVDAQTLIGRAARALMGISGSLALLLFVYGGFLMATSAGNMDKVKQGKKLFMSATIGLLVIFSSYILVAALFNAIGL